jgi:hypothetical protein
MPVHALRDVFRRRDDMPMESTESGALRPHFDWLKLMTTARLVVGGGILGAAAFDLIARLTGLHHGGAVGFDAIGAFVGMLTSTVVLFGSRSAR